MAQYYSDVDYRAEEMNRPYANPGFCHGEGGKRFVAYEEVDEVSRAGRGHHHLGRSGHLAHSGSHHGHLGDEGHLGHRKNHGHGGRRYDACESKYDSCTGEYYG